MHKFIDEITLAKKLGFNKFFAKWGIKKEKSLKSWLLKYLKT